MKVFKTCEDSMDFDNEFTTSVEIQRPKSKQEGIEYKYLDPNMKFGSDALLTWQAFLATFLLVTVPLFVYFNSN